MKKIHTRFKRHYAGLATHKNWYHLFHDIHNLRRRAKTFMTQEGAHAWAKLHNVASYDVVEAKGGKKWKVEVKL